MKGSAFKAVVLGCSAGGLDALSMLFAGFSKALNVPIFIVQHISPNSESFMIHQLQNHSKLPVHEVFDKMDYKAGHIYIAPPDYHLLIENHSSMALSNEEKVNYSRPAIDVLFESAVWVFGSALIGIILTGANADGATGLYQIKMAGGLTIVQDPKTAEVARMPLEAIKKGRPDHILGLSEIASLLNSLLV